MNELRYVDTTGNTLYAVILDMSGDVWNGTAFVALVEASWATYDIPLAEHGTTGLYFADMPVAITAGTYEILYYRQAGVGPVVDNDTFLDREWLGWNGVALTLASGYNYLNWPGTDHLDDILAGAGVTLRAEVTIERKQALIDAVAAQVTRETRVQFVASPGVRYFDGTGTPEMDIDEFISFSLVRSLWGSTGALSLTSVIALPEDGLPNTRIALFRGGLPTLGGYLVDRFPVGRGNIEVTGTWGYASTIPADLWEAVAQEAAARLVDETGFTLITSDGAVTSQGPLISWRQGDVSKTWGSSSSSDRRTSTNLGWHDAFRAALARYTRSGARQLRQLRPVMI